MKNLSFSSQTYSAICIIAFLTYVNAGLLTLPHLASVLTGNIVRQFHFSPLSPINREVRSEGVYVLIAFSGNWLFSKLKGGIRSNVTSLQFSKVLPETIFGFLLQLIPWLLAIVILAHFRSKPIVVTNHHFPFANLIILYLLTAIAEETVFRGYIFQMTEKYWGTGIAICVSSSLFGLDHLVGARLPFYTIICIIIFGGLTYSAAFAYTRCLWLPIGLHWGDDFGFCLFNSDHFHVKLYQTDVTLEAGNIVSLIELFFGIILVVAAIRSQRWRSFRNTQTTAHPMSEEVTSSAE